MRFSNKHGFVLISNWKCGCSSITSMFEQYAEFDSSTDVYCKKVFGEEYYQLVHERAAYIKELFAAEGWDWDNYVSIISIRNPWARIVSLYAHHRKHMKLEFTNFVRSGLAEYLSMGRRRYLTNEMINDSDGRPLINYVVHLEHLADEMELIRKKHFPSIELDYTIHVDHGTVHDHYQTYYTWETKEIVRELFQYDIRLGGYIFEQEEPINLTPFVRGICSNSSEQIAIYMDRLRELFELLRESGFTDNLLQEISNKITVHLLQGLTNRVQQI